ncbi:hypothetical protein GWK47_027849 [Chionoecetes opilio]|uniref:Uncharacterized protein n=1 Tax=Chionoecetes opilio TaxID=41210 RepID=A0A8J8W9P9_CHIOP|nr:hypothetical protein GWK47_027849 [Chionoecetes opilio]
MASLYSPANQLSLSKILRDTPPCARRKAIFGGLFEQPRRKGGRGLRRSSIYAVLTPLDLRFVAGSGPRALPWPPRAPGLSSALRNFVEPVSCEQQSVYEADCTS